MRNTLLNFDDYFHSYISSDMIVSGNTCVVFVFLYILHMLRIPHLNQVSG